ncbi:MAG: hypothetical protein H6739_01520 [Alphaproteobacteria bacterium]|nr:hypothetical protein [Alphaproteobacteria bacterium]
MHAWNEILDTVRFGPSDAERLAALLPYAEPDFPRIAERFYAGILSAPGARVVLQDDAQVERLKLSLVRWLRELLSGPHDQAYWARRSRIGATHVRVGLPAEYVFSAMNLLRIDLVDIARRTLSDEAAWETCHAIGRITDLELAVMNDAYMGAHENMELRSLQDIIIRSLPVTVLCMDPSGAVTAATRPSARLFDLGAKLGRAYTDFLPEALLVAGRIPMLVERARASGHEVNVPRVVVGEGTHARTFRVNIVPLRHELADVLLHVEELTDAVQAEARARQAEALARIGALAANVAHEIRNPLTAISAALQVITGTMDEDDRRRSVLGKVREQVLRMDRLVEDLLGYARPGEARLSDADLRPLVQEAVDQAGVDATIVGLPDAAVRCDPEFVRRVLVNLLQNARDASGPGGRVEVEITDDPGFVVSDSGPGVDPEVADTLFEPFVTTKARGTGLGLAICLKLVTAMGGALSLEPPAAGDLGGARFRVSLPAQGGRTSPSGSGGYSG